MEKLDKDTIKEIYIAVLKYGFTIRVINNRWYVKDSKKDLIYRYCKGHPYNWEPVEWTIVLRSLM